MYEEKSLVATLIQKPDSYYSVDGIVKPSMFEEYGNVAEVIWAIIEKGRSLNYVTLEEESKGAIAYEDPKIWADGKAGISIKELVPYARTANVESAARLIRDKYFAKEFIGEATSAMMEIEQGNPTAEVISTFSEKLSSISNEVLTKKQEKLEDQISEAIKHIESRAGKDGLTGIDTGSRTLNDLTGGWQDGNQIIVGGRPGMGKTAYMLNVVLAALKSGVKCAIFSWEMTAKQLLIRLNALVSGVNSKKIMRGNLNQEQSKRVYSAFEKLSTYPLQIVSDCGDIVKTRAKYMVLKIRDGVKLFAFDFIQRVNFKGDRYSAITEISRTLANLAKDTGSVNIVLAQLSRAVESRGGSKKPLLSDLKETGAIEEDAHIVIFPYRPEYYGIAEDEEGNSLKGKADLIVAKNRDGDTGVIRQDFQIELGAFTDEEDEDFLSINQEPPNMRLHAPNPNDDLPF